MLDDFRICRVPGSLAANFEDHARRRLDQSQPWSKPENARRYLLGRISIFGQPKTLCPAGTF
jgi:hypothetical protein